MAAQEKRAHERSTVRFACRVRLARGKVLDGCVENLGVLGALVSTSDLEAFFDVGDHVTLTIDVPDRPADSAPIEIEGEVLRLEQEFSAGDIRRAFAVRFNTSFALF